MTWARQVVHVAWTDVRESRWILGAFIAVCVTISVLRPSDANGTLTSPVTLQLGACVIATFAIASVVQNDTPATSGAFWTSRPIFWGSVLAAKLLITFVVVILLPSCIEAWSLARVGISVAAIVREIVRELAPCAVFVASFLLLGALTRDLKTFVLGLVGVFVSMLTWGNALDNFGIRAGSFEIGAKGWVTTVAVLVITATLYRARDLHAWRWAVALVVAMGPLAVLIPNADRPHTNTMGPKQAPPVPSFRIAAMHMLRDVRGNYRLSFAIESPLDASTPFVNVHNIHVAIAPPTGRTMLIDGGFTEWVVRAAWFPNPGGQHWPANVVIPNDPAIDIPLEMRASTPALSSGTTVTIDAMVTARWRALSPIVMVDGSHVTDGVHSIHVNGIVRDSIVRIALDTYSLVALQGAMLPFIEADKVHYVLLNRTRREAVTMESGHFTWRSFGNVLPGSSFSKISFELSAQRNGVEPRGLFDDPQWLATSELVVLSSAGGGVCYPVHMTHVVP